MLIPPQSPVDRRGQTDPHAVDDATAGAEIPSPYAQVLRQFSPEVADEYERVQLLGRNRPGRTAFAIHPKSGCRVALDYEQPPQMEVSPVEYDLDGVTIQLHNSHQSHMNLGAYNVRLTAAMRDELMLRDLAHIDSPMPWQTTYRFLACRMCPHCFKGPLSEDEVNASWTVHFECLCYNLISYSLFEPLSFSLQL
jgi:hypothetical protein